MTFFRAMDSTEQPCCDRPTSLKKRVLTVSEVTSLAEVTAFLHQPYGQFIASQREAGHGTSFAVVNPATGQAIAGVTVVDSDQAGCAMENARQVLSQ